LPRPYVSLVGPLLEAVCGRPRLWHHEDKHLSLGPTVTDQVWARNERDTLDEDEALKLAYDELKAMRGERRDSGKAAS
jgi:hypothetical protein